MSVPQSSPLTIEGVLEMFRESREQFRESREQFREVKDLFLQTDKQIKATQESLKATQKEVGKLGSRVGEIVEKMVAGNISAQFRELGYKIKKCGENVTFGEPGSRNCGEVDLLLEDGNVAILIEVKTTLKTDHIHEHIDRLEKYRRCIDSGDSGEKRSYIGAVAGTTVPEHVTQFAHENGMYVIVQSARATEILPRPDGFVAKKW